jgi:hypothetical protein
MWQGPRKCVIFVLGHEFDAKPWLVEQQPSDRGGVLQVMTRPMKVGKRGS